RTYGTHGTYRSYKSHKSYSSPIRSRSVRAGHVTARTATPETPASRPAPRPALARAIPPAPRRPSPKESGSRIYRDNAASGHRRSAPAAPRPASAARKDRARRAFRRTRAPSPWAEENAAPESARPFHRPVPTDADAHRPAGVIPAPRAGSSRRDAPPAAGRASPPA